MTATKQKSAAPKRMNCEEIAALAESMSHLCDNRHIEDVFSALAYLLAHAIIEADRDPDVRREILEGHIDFVDSLLDIDADD